MAFGNEPRKLGSRRLNASGTNRAVNPRNFVQVARGGGVVVIHVVGSGNMVIAPVLNEFIEKERQAGFKRYIFDLSQCRGLDSTFMGCMVGLSNALTKDHGGRGQMEEPAELIPMSPEEALQELQKTLKGKEISRNPVLVFD